MRKGIESRDREEVEMNIYEENKDPLGLGSLFFRSIVYMLVFCMSFLGMPFPAYYRSLPRPLELARAVIGEQETEAAQIKSVQNINTPVGGTDLTVMPSLPSSAVVTNNSLILQSVEVDTLNIFDSAVGGKIEFGGEGPGCFTSTFEDIQTLNISRGRAADSEYAPAADIGSHVMEFADGVTVLRASGAISPTSYVKNILLPQSVGKSKSFPIATGRGNIIQADETEAQMFKATLPDLNPGDPGDVTPDGWCEVLILERLDLPSATPKTAAPTLNIEWQVIELKTDVVVTPGETTIAAGSASSGDVAIGLGVADNKTFLVFSYTVGNLSQTGLAGDSPNGIDTEILTRGTVNTTADTVTFTRGGNGTHPAQIAYYVVELTDPSSWVQKNSTNIPLGDLFADPAPTFTAVDRSRAFPIISASVSASATNNLSDGLVRIELTADDTLALERRTSAVACDVDWFVVELSPLTLDEPGEDGATYTYEAGDMVYINWTHAASLDAGTVQIEYSYDNGVSWNPLDPIISSIAASNKTYEWKVGYGDDNVTENFPDNENDTQCLIRIANTAAPLDADRQYDESNIAFTIKSKLELVTPDGTEVGANAWNVGETNRNIEWKYWGTFVPATVILEYQTAPAGAWTIIDTVAYNYPGTVVAGDLCSYNWNPGPGNGLPLAAASPTTRVRVRSTSAPVPDELTPDPNEIFSQSPEFTIQGSIAVTYPDPATGTDQLATGYPYDITWTLNCAPTGTATIKYSLVGDSPTPADWTEIDNSPVDPISDGTVSWTPDLALTPTTNA